MHIVVPAGGIGAARFLRGLLAATRALPDVQVTVIGNTADDITLMGLRICPDLDTVMYTLGGGISEEQGWGRDEETFVARTDLEAYSDSGIELPTWFGLGDRDIATHLARAAMLHAGKSLSEVTAALCARWKLPELGVRLLPMSDNPVETYVLVDAPDGSGRRWVHFQEYWVRWHAQPPAIGVQARGAADASPAPGVLEAIGAADVILLPPSNPVVSLGTIFAVPGIGDALRATGAPVVGIAPIIGGRPVRGMADKMLAAVGVPVDAAAVALHLGTDLLDGWLVHSGDSDAVDRVQEAGIACRAVPLLMTDVAASATIATAALTFAHDLRR